VTDWPSCAPMSAMVVTGAAGLVAVDSMGMRL